MLRTTFSRLRKVCSIAFLPRILRGDPSSAVSSAVVRKAFKSTKSTEDGVLASTEQCKDIIHPNMFSPTTSHVEIDENIKKKIADPACLGDKTANENKQKILAAGLPLTHRERCQRIIDQAFGKSSNTQPDGVLAEQYFSHTVVNLEDTRREIHESEKAKLKLQEQQIHTDDTKCLLPYNRSQYSIFKMSRELNLNDDNNQDGVSIAYCASAKEPDLIKNLENVKGTAEETPPVEEPNLSQAKQNFNECVEDTRREIHESEKSTLKLQEHTDNTKSLVSYNRPQYSIFKMSREINLIDDNNHDGISIPHSAKEPDLIKNLESVKGTAEETPPVEEPNLSQAKEDFDKSVNNPESIEKKALCDDDAETIEVVKDERKHDLYQEAMPNDQPSTPQTLNASAAKQQRQAKVTYQTHVPWFLNATTAREPYLTYAKEDFDKTDNNPESVEKKALCDDAKTDELVTDEIKHDLLNQEAKPNDQPHTSQVLNATTAKQDEELLTQKLETIEETPLVEAHKPKIESSVTPKVLGNEAILNSRVIENTQDKSPDVDLDTCQVLNATTAKQDEEVLTQKLETIEETPLVEAHKPKLEGFVTPRVLGYQTILNSKTIENTQDKSPDVNLHTSQVLDATTAKHDEELLTRKLETKKETFVVEAHKPKLEGSVTRKVLGNKAILNSNVIENTQDKSSDGGLHTSLVLNATTAKHDEELLTRKLETKEETPGVEAHKPKLEGSVTPRVLGNDDILISKVIENTQDKSPDVDLPGALDEVSKRCLKCPVEQIDEMLINEMEKLGMTYKTAQRAPSTHMEDDVVQMDEQKIQSESTKLKEKQNERPTDIGISDVKNEAEGSEEFLKPDIDLKPLSFKSVEYNPANDYNNTKKFACHYLLPTHGEVELDKQEQRQTTANTLFVKVPYTNFGLPREKWNKEIKDLLVIDKTIQQSSNKLYSTEKSQAKSEQDSENVSFPEDLLIQRPLEPSFVLTCNETCPISPGPTMSACQMSDFVDTTETIYMKKNICESVRPKPQPMTKGKEKSQVNPMVMEVNSETIPEIKATDMTGIICGASIPEGTDGKPGLDEQVSLTELLRRVRERSRLAYSEVKVGKCGRKSPQCIPNAPRSPPNNPVPPPTFGLPMVKRMPPACRPKRRPLNKCSRATNFPEIPYELNEAEVCAVRSNVNLTDEIIDRLQNLGKFLGGVLLQTKSNVDMLARDYEPWTPIPSYNPPKVEKKEWRPAMPCIKDCPNFPKARKSVVPDPPCYPNSCEGFPKRRSFSMLDCFTVSLGETIVYDLGDF